MTTLASLVSRPGPRAGLFALFAAGLALACGSDRDAPAAEPQTQTPSASDGPAPQRPVELFADWDPEAFSDAVHPTLERLREAIEHDDDRERRAFTHLVPGEIACDPLRPLAFEPPLELGPARRRRALPAEEPRTGVAGLLQGLRELHAALAQGGFEVHVKLKVVGVEPLDGNRATTTLWVQTVGTAPLQIDAHWRLSWSESESFDPRLEELAVVRHDEIERLSPTPFFVDATESVLGAAPSFGGLLRPRLDHWLTRLDTTLGNDLFGLHGLSVADVDGDGLDDLFVCLEGGLPNRLYLQRADGTAEDRSHASGLNHLDDTRAALFADFDGDGDQDVALAAGELAFLVNDGSGVFTDAASVAADQVHSLAAADHDLDGDLDLYACRYATGDRLVPDPYFDAHNGPPNRMLANETRGGELRLRDVTAEVGLDAGNDRFSLAAAWADHDLDGDPDLYVANDFGRNNLYQNEHGRFREVSAEAGVEDVSASRSAAWGDADGDGRPDLYVGNVFSSAGNRLVSILHGGGAAETTRHLFERHAHGNSLFRNREEGAFEDVSEAWDATLGRWAWSSLFAELDNDGREDLLIANGFVSNQSEEDL